MCENLKLDLASTNTMSGTRRALGLPWIGFQKPLKRSRGPALLISCKIAAGFPDNRCDSVDTVESDEKAEREGFEPSVPVKVHRFSRPAHSATLSPLRRLYTSLKLVS